MCQNQLQLHIWFLKDWLVPKHLLYSVIFLTKIYQSFNTPCLSTPAESTLEFLLNFSPPRCILHNFILVEMFPFDIPRWFSDIRPDEFWYYPGGITRIIHPGSYIITFLSNSRVKFLEYGRLVFIYFYQLFMMKWEPLSKPFGWRFSRVIIRDHHMFTFFGIVNISGQR